MILPSKELLSAVYGTKITRCDNKINDFKNELYFESEQYGNGEYIKFYVNINQIAQVMKKWALTKGFYVLSMIDEFGGMALVSTKKNSNIHNEVAREEAEAVFKICEWILEQRNEK